MPTSKELAKAELLAMLDARRAAKPLTVAKVSKVKQKVEFRAYSVWSKSNENCFINRTTNREVRALLDFAEFCYNLLPSSKLMVG